MRILALETSCDETAAAVVENGTAVSSSVIATSKEAFSHSGGVIPESAARQQIAAIHPVIDAALREAHVTHEALDALAVTRGPGLLGSLLVGTMTARTLAALWKKPLIGVHHTLGHLSSTWLERNEPCFFPLLALSASGGHTELWLRHAHTKGELLGQTRDDAAGEAFDKGASLLALPYPGGPSIARAATSGNPKAFPFPLPLAHEETSDFSFSGLKTAMKYTVQELEAQGIAPADCLADLAASYQHALCRHLVDRVERALRLHPEAREVHLVGGVSANTTLRSLLIEALDGRPLLFPTRFEFCTDNGAMIGAAAAFSFAEKGKRAFRHFTTAASLPSTDVFGEQD